MIKLSDGTLISIENIIAVSTIKDNRYFRIYYKEKDIDIDAKLYEEFVRIFDDGYKDLIKKDPHPIIVEGQTINVGHITLITPIEWNTSPSSSTLSKKVERFWFQVNHGFEYTVFSNNSLIYLCELRDKILSEYFKIQYNKD